MFVTSAVRDKGLGNTSLPYFHERLIISSGFLSILPKEKCFTKSIELNSIDESKQN